MTLSVFPDNLQCYFMREQIVPLQMRLVGVARIIRSYYNEEYSTVLKGEFDKRLTAYPLGDGRSSRGIYESSAISYPRSYSADLVTVSALEWKRRGLEVAELQLVVQIARNRGRAGVGEHTSVEPRGVGEEHWGWGASPTL